MKSLYNEYSSYLLAFDWMAPDRRSVGFMLGYPAFSPISSRVSSCFALFSSKGIFQAAVAAAGSFSCWILPSRRSSEGPALGVTPELDWDRDVASGTLINHIKQTNSKQNLILQRKTSKLYYLNVFQTHFCQNKLKELSPWTHRFYRHHIEFFTASTFLLFPEASPLSRVQLLLRLGVG